MESDWVYGLIGGALIGAGSAILLLGNGRIAGVSGIIGGLLKFDLSGDMLTRVLFVAGLIVGPLLVTVVIGQPDLMITGSIPLLIIGGLLVGFGTRLGNGCTSGHGVCGVSRLSRRSVVATITFMAVAALTVAFVRHVIGAIT
jgi:uncharacterized membrane protein YedE/YeeE